MFYFAYGSNLWRDQMRRRCPAASCLGLGLLSDYRWLITLRGYASIVSSPGDQVYGIVYRLTPDDEAELDRHEGVARGCYRKQLVTVDHADVLRTCLTYIDPITQPGLPRTEYIGRINRGLDDAGLPHDYVSRYLRPFIPA